jgi:hypothetical protein
VAINRKFGYESRTCDGQVKFIYVLKSKFAALSRVVLFLWELDILIFG